MMSRSRSISNIDEDAVVGGSDNDNHPPQDIAFHHRGVQADSDDSDSDGNSSDDSDHHSHSCSGSDREDVMSGSLASQHHDLDTSDNNADALFTHHGNNNNGSAIQASHSSFLDMIARANIPVVPQQQHDHDHNNDHDRDSNIPAPSTSTYADEDDKAAMMMQLMKNHADAVAASLVERSNLIQSVTWLARHIPECVLSSLLDRLHLHNNSSSYYSSSSNFPLPQLLPLLSRHDDDNDDDDDDDNDNVLPLPLPSLPITEHSDSALLFVDISGFTKISVELDVETLSNAINSYFEMIVNEIRSCGGDVLKFAGDAIFAEWRVVVSVSDSDSGHDDDDDDDDDDDEHQQQHRTLEQCVSLAATCAAAIVANCSDYAVAWDPIGSSRRSLINRSSSIISKNNDDASSSSFNRASQQSQVSSHLESTTEGGGESSTTTTAAAGGGGEPLVGEQKKFMPRRPIIETSMKSSSSLRSSVVSADSTSFRSSQLSQLGEQSNYFNSNNNAELGGGGEQEQQQGDDDDDRNNNQTFVPMTIIHPRPQTQTINSTTILKSSSASVKSSMRSSAISSSNMRSSALTTDSSLLTLRCSQHSNNNEGGESSEQQQHSSSSRPPLEKRLGTIVSSARMATLNVKCAVGAGHIVGIHVGDVNSTRREYFILGDPIDQVAEAESVASHGEVFASPEAMRYLMKSTNTKTGSSRVSRSTTTTNLREEGDDCDCDWEEAVEDGRPVRIADRDGLLFDIMSFGDNDNNTNILPNNEAGSMLHHNMDDLNSSELLWLKSMISLYVHPVVVNDENERAVPMRRGSDHDRHLAEAELRNVYTCFITSLIDHKLTGDEEQDNKLFKLLNDIMNLATRELGKVQGHLRQFMVDDKGLVLICTFGLRGSTFPNMIAQRALPFSLSIHQALELELGVRSTIGASFGKAYCGVVGGLERHEFAVLGPSVNLSARLMASADNPGILVDKNVRLLTSQIFFKPLPAVVAKGYDEPVPIFEPVNNQVEDQWGHTKKDFVGRVTEIKKIMRTAKDMAFHGIVTKLMFISAMSGTGKSSLMVQSIEHVRAMMKKMKKRAIITRNVSREGDSRIPFSLFRSIFKDILAQISQEDEEYKMPLSRNGSGHKLVWDESSSKRRLSEESTADTIDGMWDSLSLHSQSTRSSTVSTDATRFRFICHELNAPVEFIEVVGKRLLGLRDNNLNNSAGSAKPLHLKKVVDFMADAFIRCTKQANLVLLALDDVQWMDEMSWNVVQAIFERGKNVFILCGSRPPSSNPLTVDPEFWSDLQGRHQDDGRYSELRLTPFNEAEVLQLISTSLDIEVDEIDTSFSHNVFTTSGGMPHYLSYVLDKVKRNKLTVRLDNGMVGIKTFTGDESKLGFGSVSELLLSRLDALDSSVRTVLHLSAVLGTAFQLLDAALAYEAMFGIEDAKRFETAMALRASFDVAVEEGIIEKSFAFVEEDGCEELVDEEDNLCISLEKSMISSRRKEHPFYAENCQFRFSHDSWKESILSVMLDERIQEMHEYVAISLEKELDDKASSQVDFEMQIRVFNHWKSCGNFAKAASLALNVGGQLMLLGLNSQAILLFDDVLNILKEMTDGQRTVTHGGISTSILDAINASELDYLIKLNTSKGKALGTMIKGVESAKAYQSALDILNNTPCASDNEFDRSISFPIFSGLFLALKVGAIDQDEERSYEKDLCKQFGEQARLNGDPVHYGRALAMEAETLGRLGNFEQALEVLNRIKAMYNIETQHVAICKAYGGDRVAQAFSHSVNFNNALGRTQAALDTCNYIVEELVPKCDPRNVHNSFCLLYPVIFTLKENGLALKAHDIFQLRVVDPFDEYFGPGGSTYSKPMFKPILTMLELQGRQDQEADTIIEYMAWALDGINFERKLESSEKPWAMFCASPNAVLGEICFSLARRQECFENEGQLLQKAISLMEQSVANTTEFPYPHMYAMKKLDMMKKIAERMLNI